jgi:threonine synthase
MASNDEIVQAIQLLAATEGIWTETAGGTTLAVAKKLIEQGRIDRDESTVVCITGNGLKTLEAVKDSIGAPIQIQPTLASFEERVLSQTG